MSEPWWKSAVVYQIYPRSFADANGDGVGDLAGIRTRLDHLAWLGVDALWISPFFPSPMKDFGYDVADYCDVDPLFGSLDDFDALLRDAHARDIRVLLDWVPNHTSDEHPWFQEARAARTSPRRDWYVWRDGGPERPPNNWRSAFGPPSAWTWDEKTQQWYLHLFLPEQPDLNWDNPEVVAAMHDTLRFWLDRGADGFRMDVVHCIGKDPALPDMPAERERIPACALIHDERTHAHLREIRRLIDAYSDDRVMVGEVAVPWIERMATYYGDGDELHLSFNFPHIWAPWEAAAWRRCIDQTTDALAPRAAWPTWVLSNHDNPRHRTRYGSESRARAAAVALLGLRGTPFLYAGEELGLTDAEVPEQRVVDPGGRDGCRAPIPWDDTPERGWGPDPWLPWPPADDAASAAAQRDDPGSTLHLYRALLAARRGSAALRLGDMEWLETPDDVLAWTRRYDGDVRAIAVNFGAAESEVEIPGHWRVEATSDRRGEGGAFDGRLGSEQAALLTPDTP